ncbi:MAG TPA: acyclic terpene utilization AtuA family protein [Bradyrhizobium sp.]|uniref:acyclic terpene utilization AtuA family protein n=1 Tax=Bradyrhizobium sp. TaxID=376 RepID=UPI002BDD829B|nr:acyclic terpene utilization AtuA family protein [Bradyrhizobium sp.]HLZ06214.1 acyclic terpene utilization AtuA family protein [Bradyrhizobium sp.]
MAATDDVCVRVLVPTGALGFGIRSDEVDAGLALAPHAIAVDAGSTDSGPAYLATGRTKYARGSIKRDLSILIAARRRAGIPLLIGSCGTSGCDMAVDQTLEIVLEVAREQGDAPRIAVIYSEQSAKDLKARNASGMVTPLAPAAQLNDHDLDVCTHIVALLGPEPYIEALASGADIVLGGRTTDTAVLAAVPLMRGADVAAAWHAAKVAECGGLCTVNPTSPGVMMSVDRHGFTIEPLSAQNRCTPETVSAHMLYENSDPFRLVEPGGVLDVTDAEYVAIDDRRVRVTGSRWERRPYTMKLEGAGGGPFQTIMLIGIEDPAVLVDVDSFVMRMERALRERVSRTLGTDADIDLSLRPYGWNAVSGRPVDAGAAPPREICLMFVATAPTQAMATEVARICNPLFFHFPAHEGSELPSYAFPFSPAEIERGQVFAFHLNHVVHTASPFELARTRWVDGPPALGKVANAQAR